MVEVIGSSPIEPTREECEAISEKRVVMSVGHFSEIGPAPIFLFVCYGENQADISG